MTQSTWEESAPSMVAACVCRNCRQVVSVCRPSVGGFFCAVRTRRIVDTLTRWPSFSSSPWTRWYPQPWFSIARRLMTTVISDWQDLAAAAARRRPEAGVQIGGSMRGGIDQALVTGCHLVLGAASPSEYARPASFLLLATAGPGTPG